MEAVVRYVQLVEELERHVGFAFGQRQRVARLLPGTIEGTDAEHVRAVPTEGMPVTGGETQMFRHALAKHQFIRIVVMKGQGVIAGWAFVAHLLKLIKI
ncbi:hypothetical protein D3C76_1672180 [compost metagenome]